MKRNIIIAFFSLLFMQGMTTSCGDWLDVDSSANVIEEVLFEDPEGYRTAVNGVYRLLAQPALYGQQLTWGVASVLGNNYEATRLPLSYRDLAAGDYKSAYSVSVVDPVWEAGYHAIANCNNVITYIEQEDPAIFPEGKTERDMILGEMLGARAMVHLDLARLFAPSTRADDGKLYMPYATVFPDRQPLRLTVTAMLGRVIADLERSRDLLADCDTTFNASRMSNYTGRLQPPVGLNATTFFSTRGTRFNYFAALSILARAYQWRDAPGDRQRAYEAARQVYRFSTDKTWFSFTPSTNLATTENNIYRKMPHDILFALYNSNLYTIVAGASPNSTQVFVVKNDAVLFESDLDDARVYLINTDKTSRRWSMPTGNQTGYPTADIIRYQGPLAPVARLSEMIYIMCEYLSDTDLPRAVTLLEKVRTARGAKALLGVPSREEFLQALYLEMTREFLAEGQTFYLYKRLNAPIYNGLGAMDMTGRYVLPLPRSESAYINL
ncbi:MAG: RagB/SusD family nutrient uptake outer membrane protein [Odoribacteraceae bacterium]|nr:RagB/SusD family nutrient uptake outer membrane protein [Odoribacteraceae bacterium]